MKLFRVLSVVLLGTMVAWSSSADAQPLPASFVGFSDFVATVASASSRGFLGRPGMAVVSEAAFQEMRSHVLKLYDGVLVDHSFLLDAQYFDCIPIEQQPSVRLSGLQSIATPPPSLPRASAGHANPPSPLELGLSDPFGNQIECPVGTIPMRRITLEEVAHSKTLSEFFKKSPGEPPPFAGPPPGGSSLHEYSIMIFGSPNPPVIFAATNLNVWNPSVTGSGPYAFSLSQLWMINSQGEQTAEAGWQVSPDHYHTSNSVLFIYWTADGYMSTGCYNLECPAFVQTNNQVALGASNWTGSSVAGGQQVWYDVEWINYNGNWWLAHGCDSIVDRQVTCFIGYYPAAVYSSARGVSPTLPTYANLVEFGGEVYSGDLGSFYPQMGSGAYVSAGPSYAAEQDGICFQDNKLNLFCGSNTWGTQVNLPCYSIQCAGYPHCTGSSFYFGGPGGNGC